MVVSGLVSLLKKLGLGVEEMRGWRLATRICEMVWWDGLLRLVVPGLLETLLLYLVMIIGAVVFVVRCKRKEEVKT
jgi:hypothetical protein